MSKPIEIDDNCVVFQAVLKGGVEYIPAKMVDWVDGFVKRRNRKRTVVEGNGEHTRFYFEPAFEDEDEYETMLEEEGLL